MIKTLWRKIKNFFHLIEAILANFYYGFPSKKIKVIGITGTDGKTTTTHLIAHILEKNGFKVSYVSSLYAKVANKIYDTGFHVTTPSAFFLQKLLKESVKNNDDFFVLETTSHALDQNRVWGVKYEIGLVTNVTHEHLDYHQTYENYLKTKLKLLLLAKKSFVNKDDQSGIFFKKYKNKINNLFFYKKLEIFDQWQNLTDFNKKNYSAAFAVCFSLGLSKKAILTNLKNFSLPKGRFDLVYDKQFKVIIDFAHTPNAFRELLPEIRKRYLKKNGRLIHVFGSAGLRDKQKRPIMGKISSLFSDYIILTEEDYRTEDPKVICQEIANGIKKKPYQIVIDRQQAINQAIKMAKKDDIVVLTGKAHEKSLCRDRTEHKWDEYLAVKKALKINHFS